MTRIVRIRDWNGVLIAQGKVDFPTSIEPNWSASFPIPMTLEAARGNTSALYKLTIQIEQIG